MTMGSVGCAPGPALGGKQALDLEDLCPSCLALGPRENLRGPHLLIQQVFMER